MSRANLKLPFSSSLTEFPLSCEVIAKTREKPGISRPYSICGPTQGVFRFDINDAQPKAVVSITLAVTVLDKRSRFVDGPHTAFPSIFNKFWSI